MCLDDNVFNILWKCVKYFCNESNEDKTYSKSLIKHYNQCFYYLSKLLNGFQMT